MAANGMGDYQVFLETANTVRSETLSQQIDLFNQKTNGAIVLKSANHSGDYFETALFATLSGLVRTRDAYDDSAVTPVKLAQILDRSVKVDAGTPAVDVSPHYFQRIGKNPESYGAILGEQLAQQQMAHMLNKALGAVAPAVAAVTSNLYDVSALTPATTTQRYLVATAGKLGDRLDSIACWVMHSKALLDIWDSNLANSNILFNFGNVTVRTDPLGKPIVMTDATPLVITGSPTKYYSVGLVAGGIVVEENADYYQTTQEITGQENIVRKFQAQWSFNLGLKGFAWDKANGGASPTDAELATATNWDKYATSAKQIAGVVLKSQ